LGVEVVEYELPGHPTWHVAPWSGLGFKYVNAAVVVVVVVLVAAIHTIAGLVGGLIAAAVVYAVIGLVTWTGLRLSARALANAPPGTLFAARGWIPVQSLRSHPHFASLSAGRRVTVPARVLIDRTGMNLQPLRTEQGVAATVSWPDVMSLTASRESGKALAGSVTLTLADGAQMRVGVMNYRRLASALKAVCDPA
jgi:hypothetical protein